MNIVNVSYYLVLFTYFLDYLELPVSANVIKRFAILLLFFIFIYSYRNEIRNNLIPKPITFAFFILFNILGVVTTLITEESMPSLITLIGLNLYFIVYYFSSYHISLDKSNLLKFNNVVIFTSTIMCLFAFISNFSLTISQFSTDYYGRTRIYGVFQEPNLLASVCFVTLVADFINLRLTNNRRYKILYVALFIIFSGFLILSDSRGALLTFIIFLSLYLIMNIYFRYAAKVRKRLVILFLLLIVIALPLTVFSIYQRISSSFNNLNIFTSGRLGNWIFIYNKLYNDPLHYAFGMGLSSGDQGALFHLGRTSDNGYLIWLFQAGIISLVLIILLLINMFRINFKNKQLRIFTIPLLISYLIYAGFENFLMSFGHIVPFYCWTITFIAFHAKGNYLSRSKNELSTNYIPE